MTVSRETGRFANESFRQRSFRKRLRSVRKLLDVNSHRLFPAKVYSSIKWTDKTDRHFEVALFKPSPLG